MKNNLPEQTPATSLGAGTPDAPESDVSSHQNSGVAIVPAAPPFLSMAAEDLTDRRAQFEALRRLVQRQLLENQQLLKSILEVEQASDWATHPAALNALSQITSDTKDFYAWLMQTSLKATHATANKK
jgi:hypothetical protein